MKIYALSLALTMGASTFLLDAKPSQPSRGLFYCSDIPVELDFSLALDDFQAIPSGSWRDSFGSYFAINCAVPLPQDFSIQIGGSYGVYDWSGRASTPYATSNFVEQQGFLTVAAAYLTPKDWGFNAGVAYDWMLSDNYGLFAVSPAFDQIRAQIGYKIEKSHEVGIWGTYGIQTSHKESQNIPLEFKGISQLNAFWTYYFASRGYTMLWVGAPYLTGLRYSSSPPGNLIFGAQFSSILTKNLSVNGYGSYMWPKDWFGTVPSKNAGANICIAITYSFGKRRVQKNPYMNIANNTNFMADTNQNY